MSDPAKGGAGGVIRHACKYGAGCYRKNPEHWKDVAHPGDADWDAAVAHSASSATAGKGSVASSGGAVGKGTVTASSGAAGKGSVPTSVAAGKGSAATSAAAPVKGSAGTTTAGGGGKGNVAASAGGGGCTGTGTADSSGGWTLVGDSSAAGGGKGKGDSSTATGKSKGKSDKGSTGGYYASATGKGSGAHAADKGYKDSSKGDRSAAKSGGKGKCDNSTSASDPSSAGKGWIKGSKDSAKAASKGGAADSSSKGKVDGDKGGKGHAKGTTAAPAPALAAASGALVSAAAGARIRCKYAESCYLKDKDDHAKKYCHPGDGDWDATATATAKATNIDMGDSSADGSYGDSYCLVGMMAGSTQKASASTMSASQMKDKWKQVEHARANPADTSAAAVINTSAAPAGSSAVEPSGNSAAPADSSAVEPTGNNASAASTDRCTLTEISSSRCKLDVEVRWLCCVDTSVLDGLKNDLWHCSEKFELTEVIVVEPSDAKTGFRIEASGRKEKVENARKELCELLDYYKSDIDPAALNEACKPACAHDDDDAGEEEKEERRVDPEDGLLRTITEVQELYASQYSPQEIDLYWASMAAAEAEDNQVAAAGFPVEQEGNQRLPPPSNAAEDSGAGGGSPPGDEELPGLGRWLECLKIARHKEAINAWITENGACDLDEIVENLEDLTDAIEFSHIEKKRIHENAKAAADKARQ